MNACPCSRTVFAALLGIALVASNSRAVDPVPNSAGQSARLKYLPADYWLAAECNMSVLMGLMSTPEAMQNPQYAQFQAAMQMAKMMIGVDPQREVEHVTVFCTGEPASGGGVLCVVQGTFDETVVQQRLDGMAAQGVTRSTYKDRTVYSTASFDVTFPEPATALLGEPGQVRAAINREAAGGRPLPTELKNVLDRTPASSVVWAAVTPSTLLDLAGDEWQSDHRELADELLKIDCASTFFEVVEDGLLIKALGYASDSGDAPSLGKFLNEQKNDLLHARGSNVVWTSLLVWSEVSSDDEYVVGSLRLTGEAMTELWNTRVIVAP
jgi:hypothetical protein